MNNIAKRIERFSNIFEKKDLVSPLIANIKLKKDSFNRIKNASILYLAKIMNLDYFPDESTIMELIEKHEFKNITPTGMILPKNYSSIEYNLFLREYYSAISELYFFNKLESCHTPAHLRIKWPKTRKSDLERPRHAPEELHFDSWSGYSSLGLTFLIGVIGDIEKNRVNF